MEIYYNYFLICVKKIRIVKSNNFEVAHESWTNINFASISICLTQTIFNVLLKLF